MFAQILIGSLCNALATAGSGAALTSADIVSTHGSVTVSHDKGSGYALDDCEGCTRLHAGIAGGYRLSSTVAVAGAVRYSRVTESRRTGTAFIVTDDLRPFDIVIDNPGDNNTETIDLKAAAGWRVADHVSIGATTAYTVADRARTRDLRHANSYIDINTSAGLCLDFGGFAFAADGIYRRTVESIAFSRAGTTDVVYTPLIDYGNGLGISESYNGNGFTDDTRQPLLSQYAGASAQFAARTDGGVSLALSGSYMHRKGHYGRDSQYTIVHDRFDGSRWYFTASAHYGNSAIEARCAIDALTNYRTNYLSQLVDGVTYYRYYESTKTAAKMRISGEAAYTGYFAPIDSDTYRWRVEAGAAIVDNRVTAWLYPMLTDTHCLLVCPFVSLQGTFDMRRGSRLVAEGSVAYQSSAGDFVPDYNMYTREGADFAARLHWILPAVKALGFRPGFSAAAHSLHRYIECGIAIDI